MSLVSVLSGHIYRHHSGPKAFTGRREAAGGALNVMDSRLCGPSEGPGHTVSVSRRCLVSIVGELGQGDFFHFLNTTYMGGGFVVL